EERQAMEELRDRPGIGAGQETEKSEYSEEPSFPRARLPERKDGQRQRDAPRFGARHEEIAKSIAREWQEVRQQCHTRKTGGNAQRARRKKLGADAVLHSLAA